MGSAHLVKVNLAVGVCAIIPELSDCQRRGGGFDILSHVLPAIAFHKIETPAIKANIRPQPAQPLLYVLPSRQSLRQYFLRSNKSSSPICKSSYALSHKQFCDTMGV